MSLEIRFLAANGSSGFLASWSLFKSLNNKSAIEGLRIHRFCYSIEGEYIYCIVDETGIQPYIFREKNKTPSECYKLAYKYRKIGLPICQESLADLKKNKLGKIK